MFGGESTNIVHLPKSLTLTGRKTAPCCAHLQCTAKISVLPEFQCKSQQTKRKLLGPTIGCGQEGTCLLIVSVSVSCYRLKQPCQQRYHLGVLLPCKQELLQYDFATLSVKPPPWTSWMDRAQFQKDTWKTQRMSVLCFFHFNTWFPAQVTVISSCSTNEEILLRVLRSSMRSAKYLPSVNGCINNQFLLKQHPSKTKRSASTLLLHSFHCKYP